MLSQQQTSSTEKNSRISSEISHMSMEFIDDSLYINHDWDIFKKEEEECDAEHCHDPYHHHKK